MKKSSSHTHYETLRLDRHASPQRVRLAYRRLAQKFHPDRHQGRGDSASLMVQINQAYAVLSDPQQRAAYDERLQQDDARADLTGRMAAAKALAVQDRFGWSGWLLLGIAMVTVFTLGFVVLRMMAPARPALQVPVSNVAPAPAADAHPMPPVPAVQPWTEPPRAARVVNEATDPVARLVREGVVTPPPGETRR